MSWRLIEADCVEAMREMPESSVDAIVTDPPYGLEFMGKEWDRLGDIGEGRSIAPVKGGTATFGERLASMPSFNASQNVRCRTCGHWRFSGTPCTCAEPDFPNLRAVQAVAMQEWHHAWAVEALRVLKPGGHLLSFGGTRTYHRLVCALEDVGFEIRDCLAWLYGSGFPKSLDVSKAIDKVAGAEREIVETIPDRWAGKGSVLQRATQEERSEAYVTAPATDAARRWQGWGTALKPAFEPIVLARKPLAERNVASQVLASSTGALNIDGTRIDSGMEAVPTFEQKGRDSAGIYGDGLNGSRLTGHRQNYGRWPANVVLDEEAAAMLDEQSGERPSAYPGRPEVAAAYSGSPVDMSDAVTNFGGSRAGLSRSDSGGASRFFYTAKADRAERERGVRDYLPDKDEAPLNWSSGEQSPGTFQAEGTNRKARNHHPTVKPVDLMQWLVRLVTPPGGTVLDPFTGSGSTGIAALREGFSFIGIEREHEYVDIARARIIGDGPLLNAAAEVAG